MDGEGELKNMKSTDGLPSNDKCGGRRSRGEGRGMREKGDEEPSFTGVLVSQGLERRRQVRRFLKPEDLARWGAVAGKVEIRSVRGRLSM